MKAILSKPDHETELAGSNQPEAEEEAAIERERQRRIEDKHQD